MRTCSAVSLPAFATRLPPIEEPDPERSALAEVLLQPWPQLCDLREGHEGEDVVGFGLTHQLAYEVGADLDVRVAETFPERRQGHVRVPQEIRPSLRVDHPVRG